ncbi:hypothetical protein [Paraburkholderia hayleyella]|uniref:hypothetical protein n=1 Tax=Paraburkholderia hayleyella TaxID=2152889 RepID=UPI0012929069|nr:hypothetical protein [Paraburkholderia hayleyella]
MFSTKVPVLSVPCGFSETGLPIGMPIVWMHTAMTGAYRNPVMLSKWPRPSARPGVLAAF